MTAAQPPPDPVGIVEAARILGVHPSTVYRMIHDGRLEAWRVGFSRYALSATKVRACIVRVVPPSPRARRERIAARRAKEAEVDEVLRRFGL